ncbi:hypothetical protein EVJ58_g1247 [Rhodofomes roseus]|uniref:F-box domain-containing protein n=1 Tax=Rhodofomes roseus TaxID=34475 RepID=A0A4Y9Z3U8_9APHY|nr:hypothetical protein EVJ58_g1247 [Rhodofomes roseus]
MDVKGGSLMVVAKNSVPSLPVEICENVIEQLASEPDVEDIRKRRALLACALVCKAFYTMSRAVFCRHLAIMRWDLLQGFVKLLESNPTLLPLVESVYLSGRATRDELRPPRASGPLAAFPLIFARKLPRLRKLHICCMNPSWFYTVKPELFYSALGQFTSVTTLYMRDVTFSSANHFAKFLDSLPNLEWLTCSHLRWVRHDQEPIHPHRVIAKPVRVSLKTSLMSLEDTQTLIEFFANPDLDRAAGIDALSIGRMELRNLQHLGVKQLLHATGLSLRYLKLCLGTVVDTEENADDFAGAAAFMSLKDNRNLQIFTLKIHAFYKDTYHCSWLAPLLSECSDQLREANIHMKIGASTDILTAFLVGINSKQCTDIDDILTQPHMSRLKHVAWHIFDYTGHPVHEELLHDKFVALFPKLHSRGLLRFRLYSVRREADEFVDSDVDENGHDVDEDS